MLFPTILVKYSHTLQVPVKSRHMAVIFAFLPGLIDFECL